MEAFSAPDDGVSGEAPEPEGEAEEVAQGEEPEVAENLAVAQDPDADCQCNRDSGKQDDAEEGEAPEVESAGDAGHDGPWERVGDGEAEVAELAGVAHGAGPAEL